MPPVMPPVLPARIHDVNPQGPIAPLRIDGLAADAGGHVASWAVVVEAVEYLAPRTYADGHGYHGVSMRPEDAAHGLLSMESQSPGTPAVGCLAAVHRGH